MALAAATLAVAVNAAPCEGEGRARSAWDFLNSIGVCLHIQHGDDATRIAPLLRYTGVRNVRDAADGNYDMSGLLHVHREAGVGVVFGPGSGARDGCIEATLRAARELHEAGALVAVEAPTSRTTSAAWCMGARPGGANCRGCPWRACSGTSMRRSRPTPT